MGKIHELQDELVQNIKERKRLEHVVEALKHDVAHIKEHKDILLRQRPLPIKEGWKPPEPPTCVCGASFDLVAYFGSEDVYLCFGEYCPMCDRVNPLEDTFFDGWPFDEDKLAFPRDFINIGFQVE